MSLVFLEIVNLFLFYMAHKELWLSVLEKVKPAIKKAHFLTWFQNTVLLQSENGKVVIGVPTSFASSWIASKYSEQLYKAFKDLEVEVDNIDYEICTRLGEKGSSEGVDVKALCKVEDGKKVRKVRNVNEVTVRKQGLDGHISSKMLNDKYLLNNFVVGRDNRLPHAACSAVSENPGGIYNPLYIYGSVGLGKTHLLQAIGNQVLKNYPDMVIKYITAERFVSEVVEAIGKRHMAKFKEQYRNVDCFLIDDVQFFARKDSSQQEFFHTFNELYDSNKQIVLTSDRSPSELDDLDERLKSRFGMGMVVELLLPDFETRLAILNQKCQEFEIIIDPEVLSFIATNVMHSVRELEGVLRQVVAESQLSQRMPTIRSVAEIIRRLNKAQQIVGYDAVEGDLPPVMHAGSSDQVMKIVAEYFNLTVDDLVGKDRHKEVMMPRQICMYLIKNELGQSYEKIGMGFGGRNHTTVMHACSKTAKQLRTDLKLVKDINAIKREMGL